MSDPASVLRAAFDQLRDELLDELDRRIAPLRDEMRELRALATTDAPASLSVKRTLARHDVSISTWNRWLADLESGLDDLVIRPNGPGGKILVPVAEFDAWLRARRERAEERRERHDRRGRAVAS